MKGKTNFKELWKESTLKMSNIENIVREWNYHRLDPLEAIKQIKKEIEELK